MPAMIEFTRARRELRLPVLFGLTAAAIAIVPAVAAIPAVLCAIAFAGWVIAAPARWIPIFLAAAVLLPPLPIALGDSGPHPALAIAALGLVAGLMRVRGWRLSRDPLSRALIFFPCVLAASVAPALYYSGAQIGAQSLARVALFAISVYLFLYLTSGPARRDPADPLRTARLLYWAGCAAALFACLDFHFQFPPPAGFSEQYVWLEAGAWRRAQGLFYDASTLGNFCAFFLVMIAVALARPSAERPVSRTALLAGGVLFAAALVFSYSRASIVNVLVAGGALAVLHRRRIAPVRLAIGIAASAAAVYFAAPTFVALYWQRLSGSALYFFSASEYVLSGRVQSWRALADFLIAHPWHAILGLGYKTLPYSNVAGARLIADNMYLSLLIETGVAGLAALVWLHIAILRAAWRARASFFGAWIFCFWCGEIVQMLSGDLLTYWRVLPLYFWVLGTAVRTANDHPVP
jgi:O-antigen ligase